MVGDEPNRTRVSQKMRNNDHVGDFLCRDTQKEEREGIGVISFFRIRFHWIRLSTADRYLLNSMLSILLQSPKNSVFLL